MATDIRVLAHESVEELNEHIHTAVLGKAYIAVLKHRLANPDAEKSSKQVFDEALSAGLKLVGRENGAPTR